MTGTIPPQLGNLSNLTGLYLWRSQLRGDIPTQLGNLSNLTDLNLTQNELTGTIPSSLGNLSDLTIMALGGNELTGTIPPQLGNLSNLTRLYLWGNQLRGAVPAQLGNLSNLKVLNILDNQLTGEIPDSLTRLTLLEGLRTYSNAGLCAPVDNAFQAWLQGLVTFQGSSCATQDSQEDRAVLAEFYNATNGANWEDKSSWLSDRPFREWHGVTNDANGRVTGLHLWENKLSGSIPPELGNLSELTYLILGNNQLTGSIPSQLANLSNLRAVYLGGNRLTGCIPAALQGMEFNDFDDVGLPFCAPQSPGAPSVGMVATTTMVRINSSISVTATFSEPVNGFTASDVTVANGDISNFIGSDGDSVFVFDVTPNAIGVVTVDIPAGVATDSDSQANTAAEQLSLGLPYDDDRDGRIQIAEAIAAVSDFFSGNLSIEHAIAVVSLYFASL